MMHILPKILLVAVLSTFTISMALAQSNADCDYENIESVFAQFSCEDKKSIEACAPAYGTYAAAGTFLLTPGLKAQDSAKSSTSFIKLNRIVEKQGDRSKKADPKIVSDVQNILRDLETKRISMDKDLREFSKVYAEELENFKKENGAYPKMRGFTPDTLRTHFLKIKDKVQARIPNNEFAKNFESGAKSPGDLIKRDLEKITQKYYPDETDKVRRPGISRYIQMQRDRYDYRFENKLKKQLPELPLRREHLGGSSELRSELAEYREFRSKVLDLDPHNTNYETLDRPVLHQKRKSLTFCTPNSTALKIAGAAGLGFATDMTLAATTHFSVANSINECLKTLDQNLTEEEMLKFMQAGVLKKGLSEKGGCDNLALDPNQLKLEEIGPDTSAGKFLCKLDQYKTDKSALKELNPKGLNWNCNEIDNGDSQAVQNGSQVAIMTSTGKTVNFSLNSKGEIIFETFKSDDPNLQFYLNDKIRSPMVSTGGKKDQVYYKTACASSQPFAQEMCDVSKQIENIKFQRAFCSK